MRRHKKDCRSRITYLYKHLGFGKVEAKGSYDSITVALTQIGLISAHAVSYVKNKAAYLRADDGDYHLVPLDIGMKTTPENDAWAEKKATHRSMSSEVAARFNLGTADQLSDETLQRVWIELTDDKELG